MYKYPVFEPFVTLNEDKKLIGICPKINIVKKFIFFFFLVCSGIEFKFAPLGLPKKTNQQGASSCSILWSMFFFCFLFLFLFHFSGVVMRWCPFIVADVVDSRSVVIGACACSGRKLNRKRMKESNKFWSRKKRKKKNTARGEYKTEN
jgi:hypothetical protein